MMPKIINVLMMNNELWALKLRLSYEQDFFYKTILIESRQTFSGQPKPLYYEKYKNEFLHDQSKIIYQVIDSLPYEPNEAYMVENGRVVIGNRWPAERAMRNAANKAIEQLNLDPYDVIVFQDIDEIANLEAIHKRSLDIGLNHIHKLAYHDFRLSITKKGWTNSSWNGGFMCRYNMRNYDVHGMRWSRWSDGRVVYWHIASPDYCKNLDGSPKYSLIVMPQEITLSDGTYDDEPRGWHLSNMTGGFSELMRHKTRSFAHAEFDFEANSEDKNLDYAWESEIFFKSLADKNAYDFTDISEHIPPFIKEKAVFFPILFQPNIDVTTDRESETQQDPLMDNIALGKPAFQSSVSEWSRYKTTSEDAMIATTGSDEQSYFHTDTENNPWWQVDLQGFFLVNNIKIYNRIDVKQRFKNFSIKSSVDGQDWIEVLAHQADSDFDDISLDFDAPPIARFIRVQLNGYGTLHLRQIKIFGDVLAGSNYKNGNAILVDDIKVLSLINYGNSIRNALANGSYESRERELIKKFVLPDDRVLEVGTAIGLAAMTAAGVVGSRNVVSFEANPYIAMDARNNFELNGLGGIISNVGILQNRSKFTGSMNKFFVSKEFWSSRLHLGGDDSDIVETVDIPAFCLEDEIDKSKANVIVSDIEGGEADLFLNADLTKIKTIIMETHYWTAGVREIDEMIKYLYMCGFYINLQESGTGICVMRRL